MVQIIDTEHKEHIKIKESEDIEEISNILGGLLYVPEPRLKPMIIERLKQYIDEKLLDDIYKIKIFITYNNSEYTGFVMALDHPTYTSYTRKVGTFGWLIANNYKSCEMLMQSCEEFTKNNRHKKLRGPINFPKGLGGLDIQSSGINLPMIHGVAFNDPNSEVLSYLEKLGYRKESEYICMKVTEKTWQAGQQVDKDIRLAYFTTDEMWERKEELHDLISKSFLGSLPMPDSSGRYRLEEIIRTYEEIPKSHYKIKVEDFNPETYSSIQAYQEAWKSCDMEKCVMGAPMAFDKHSGELVGNIMAIPNIYQGWLDEPITQINVDTVMVDIRYAGRGIFSALNNMGQISTSLNGINYIEGTSIWNNNPNAVKSIFPHGIPVRKHYVVQKRIRS